MSDLPTPLLFTHEQAIAAVRVLLLNPHLTDAALDALLAEYSRMESLMPIVDPTAYKDIAPRIPHALAAPRRMTRPDPGASLSIDAVSLGSLEAARWGRVTQERRCCS
jgi:hypothetical protein